MKTLSYLMCSLGLAASAGLMTSAVYAQDATKPGDPVAAQKKIAMCAGCHQIPGYQASFPEVHKVPKIAGQSASYIAAALNAYRKGDRRHPTMRGVAASLTDQDIADLSVYYAGLGKDIPAKEASGKPSEEVLALVKKGNCITCHGENLNKPVDPSYPKLGGQYADYAYVALKAYQTDNKGPIGRNNPIMSAQAKLFTLPELKLLSQYIESLGGELKTVPQQRFHTGALSK